MCENAQSFRTEYDQSYVDTSWIVATFKCDRRAANEFVTHIRNEAGIKSIAWVEAPKENLLIDTEEQFKDPQKGYQIREAAELFTREHDLSFPNFIEFK